MECPATEQKEIQTGAVRNHFRNRRTAPARGPVPVSFLRLPAVRSFRSKAARRCRPFSEQQLSEPALVLAPHPDDETLAAGGIIAEKRARGVPVTIVFVTDGARSHTRCGPGLLSRIRKNEAEAACNALGVGADYIHFLDIPEGRIPAYGKRLEEFLARFVNFEEVSQIFLPYRADGHPDHESTFRCALAGLGRFNARFDLYEYPVWAYNIWPFVGLEIAPNRSTFKALWESFKALFGLKLLGRCNTVFRLGPRLVQKEKALECYASQMKRPPGEPDWPVLADVAEGDFLELLLAPFELFKKTRFHAGP